LNIVSSESFTQHDLPALLATHFVGDHMEEALSRVQASMYSVLAPRELLMVTAKYATSMVFYTDGSLIDFYCVANCFICDIATHWEGYSTPGIVLDFD
jgi:hypothetical protein